LPVRVHIITERLGFPRQGKMERVKQEYETFLRLPVLVVLVVLWLAGAAGRRAFASLHQGGSVRRTVPLLVVAVLLSCGSLTGSLREFFGVAGAGRRRMRKKRRPTKRRHSGKEPQERKLPSFNYYLDESDPDLVVLRRQDGSFVAVFSALGVTREGIIEAAKEDYRELVRKWEESGGDPA
jgi:hypothetical protein